MYIVQRSTCIFPMEHFQYTKKKKNGTQTKWKIQERLRRIHWKIALSLDLFITGSSELCSNTHSIWSDSNAMASGRSVCIQTFHVFYFFPLQIRCDPKQTIHWRPFRSLRIFKYFYFNIVGWRIERPTARELDFEIPFRFVFVDQQRNVAPMMESTLSTMFTCFLPHT